MSNIKKKTKKMNDEINPIKDENKIVSSVEDETTSQTYLESVAHLSAAYENAQRTIRFLDTKASGVLVLVTSLVGVTGLLTRWIVDIINKESFQFKLCPLNGMQVTTTISTLLLIVFLIYVYKSVSSALNCLDPKDPRGSTTVLFPYVFEKPQDENQKQSNKVFENNLNRFIEKLEIKLAKEEYANQIKKVGIIVNEKLTASKKSISALKWLLLSCLLFAVSSVAIFAASIGLMG